MGRLTEIIERAIQEGDKKVYNKNSKYNSSKDELYIFKKLKDKWSDVVMSYTDDRFVNPETHRHFQLDFYIPSLDLGINYNKAWTHGRRPYNPDDPSCQEDVKWLESEKGDYYKRALKQWTVTDPIKRQVAKDNRLKFIEFFNRDEFETWYNDPSLTYEEYKQPTSFQYNSDEYWEQKAKGRDTNGNDYRPYDD